MWGQTEDRSYLQVIFIYREPDEIEYGSLTLEQLMALSDGDETEVLYVVHAMPMSPKMLRQYRRLRR